MKSALLYGIEDLRVVEIDRPSVGPEDILIKVKACAVCPTNVRYYRSKGHEEMSFPINHGHEYAGDVVEVGEEIKDFRVGDRVVGVSLGGFAEYALFSGEIARKYGLACLKIPQGTTYEEATFTEPVADCIHAVMDQAQVKLGDKVTVIGAGPMGLQQMMLARLSGAVVYVSETMETRLKYAEDFGADRVIDASKENPVEAVKGLTKGEGVDAVLVTIGHPAAINQGLQMAKRRGRVVIFGGAPTGTTMPLDPNIIHYGEIILTGSSGVGGRVELFSMALDIISSKKIPVAKLVTHRFPLEQIQRAYEATENKVGLKVMVIPP